MTWKGLRETLPALGVILSLIFVGYEIRQNTKVARSATYQDIGFTVLETWRQRSLDPGLAELMVTVRDTMQWDQLSDADWYQITAVLMGSMRAWEAVYRQVQEGLLPPETMGQFGYGWKFGPWEKRVWPDVERTLSDDFAAFVREYNGLH